MQCYEKSYFFLHILWSEEKFTETAISTGNIILQNNNSSLKYDRKGSQIWMISSRDIFE